MRLVTNSVLLSLLNIGSSGGGTDAGTKALDATFPLVEAATESGLVAASTTDFFNVPAGQLDPVLRLSSGFLSTPSMDVRVVGSATPIPTTAYWVDSIRGTVMLLGALGTRGNVRVSVKFRHGYEESDGELQEVPEALQQAHTFLAAAAMQISPAAMSKDKAKALGIDASRGFEYKARQILQGLHRPRALVIWPVHTSR